MERKKKLYTERDIRELGLARKVRVLELLPGDLITPLAQDAARALGMEVVRVRGEIVADRKTSVAVAVPPPAPPSAAALSPMAQIRRAESRDFVIPPFAFDVGRPEMDVRCGDVITSADGSPMAAGFLSIQKGSFPWTLNYHEVEYILEGELHIGTRDGVVIGRPGDVIFVPEGSSITFGTPSWAKFFYVTYPADWSET
jgi:ethanolamine utilization protein EutQ